MSLRKNRVLKLNILLLVLAMACLFYYDSRGGLVLKGITSAWFVGLGVLNLVYTYGADRKKLPVTWLVVTGLIFAMAADVLLGIHFILGTALFAAGHLFCCAAYCTLEHFHKKDLIPIGTACLVSLFCALGTPFIQLDDPVMKPILLAYALIISCILGKAIGNLLQKPSRTRWLLLLGSAMFWFSDLMLAWNIFGNGGHLAGTLCLYTYWPGQYLLAHTLYHFADDHME